MIVFTHGRTQLCSTQATARAHTRSGVTSPPQIHTHSRSIMLLSHSPRSHFSQSPGVCEGQSGLSSHKPRLHTRLPVKVCVSTKCNTARRKKKGKWKMILQQQCGAGPFNTASASSCLTLLEITVYLEIRTGDRLFKGCYYRGDK